MMTNRDSSELVTGREGRKEGRSTFYTTQSPSQLSESEVELETDLDKQVVNFPPYFSPPAAQRLNSTEIVLLRSLEASRASVTSADVQMTEGEQNTSVQGPSLQGHHKTVRRQSSYSTVDAKQIKMLVVGDRCTGKSSLIQRTTDADYSCHYEPTHLLNCSSKTIRHKDKLYSVTILDLTENTLLEEKHFKEFCKGAMAAFVVYDLSRMTETLSSIVEWKKKINNTVCKKNGNPIPVYLLGNKCDKEECHKDGASFTELHKFTDHFRTSAKTGEGIEEAIKAAVKEILSETYPNPPEICETPLHHKIK